LQVYFGAGDATFPHFDRYVTGSLASPQLATADLNEDGILDLAAGAEGSVTVFFGGPGGEFQAAPLLLNGVYSPKWTGIADFNGDGLNDMVTVSSVWTVSLRLGTGDGELGEPDVYNVTCAENKGLRSGLLADLNADGETDLVAVCREGGIWGLLSNGDGTFQSPVSSSAPQRVSLIAAAKFDGDI